MLNPQRLLADIDAVFLQFPDLAEDVALKEYVLQHGTDFKLAIEVCLDEMRQAETLADAIDLRCATLKERRNRMGHKAEAMRRLMQRILEHAQTSKYTTAEATLSIARLPRSVIIADEKLIPQEYQRVKTEPNKSAIKQALLDGKEIPGCCLSNGGMGLTVRTK